MLILAGCSALPDLGPLYGESSPPPIDLDEEDPEDFPHLARVPERPTDQTPAEIRQEIAEGLIADRESSRYSSEVLRGGTEPPAPPPPPAPSAPPAAESPAVEEPEEQGSADYVLDEPLAGVAMPSVGAEPVSAVAEPLRLAQAETSNGGLPQVDENGVLPPPVRGGAKSLEELRARRAARRGETPPEPETETAVLEENDTPAASPQAPSEAAESEIAAAPAVGAVTTNELQSPPAPVAPEAEPRPARPVEARAAVADRPVVIPPAPDPVPSRPDAPRPVPAEPQIAAEAPQPETAPAQTAPAQTAPENLQSAGSGRTERPQLAATRPDAAPPPRAPVRERASPEAVAPTEAEGPVTVNLAALDTASVAIPSARRDGRFVVAFGFGSTELGAAERALVREAAALQKRTGGRARVVGHASSDAEMAVSVEREIANFQTSLDRANAVAAALIAEGVPADLVIVEAKGDLEPSREGVSPAGGAGDRRAEIFIE